MSDEIKTELVRITSLKHLHKQPPFNQVCTGLNPAGIAAIEAYISKHYIKKDDALEAIGEVEERETEDMKLKSWTNEDYKAFGRNGLRVEVKSKLNLGDK